MSKKLFFSIVPILCGILVSCTSPDSSDVRKKGNGAEDGVAFNDTLSSIIHRLDGTSIDTLSLNKKIASLMDSAGVTGLAIAILNDNRIAYQKSFGYANKTEMIPLQTDHSFYGASLSKAVFGYLVAMLAKDGVIDLDKPLQQYLDIPLYQVKKEKEWQSWQELKGDNRYERITARMCLSHTTGFQNWRWIPRPDDPENMEQLKIYFEPGTQYFYSGEGIMLLQHVIEHITGKGVEELAQERIFIPLQMTHTSYIWQERFENKFCNGHTSDGQIIEKDKRDEVQAAGSLETNLVDYSIFLRHILQLYKQHSEVTQLMFHPGIRIRSKAQFGPQSLENSDENDDIQLSYGLGWGLLQSPFGLGAFKEGHDEGFQHYSIVFPEKEMGVLILSNSDNAESIFKALLEISIADTYTPWKWEHYIPYQIKQ